MSKVLMKGNEALAEAAIRAGCRHFFGYPITPQTEVSAYMAKKMPKISKEKINNLAVDTFEKNNKEIFYKDIDKYLKRDIGKKEYFENLLNNIKNTTKKPNKYESKYIDDMLTTLDIVGDPEDIPEVYLIKNMQNLLKHKK